MWPPKLVPALDARCLHRPKDHCCQPQVTSAADTSPGSNGHRFPLPRASPLFACGAESGARVSGLTALQRHGQLGVGTRAAASVWVCAGSSCDPSTLPSQPFSVPLHAPPMSCAVPYQARIRPKNAKLELLQFRQGNVLLKNAEKSL